MCLILFAYQQHPEFPLILAANRDEFYQRPSRAADFWPQQPDLLAGRDLQAGGSWMAISRQGRFAAVTNYREVPAQAGEQSRGELPLQFVGGDMPAEDYLQQVDSQSHRYAGFNLLFGSVERLYYYSNRRGDQPRANLQALAPGIYGLSNHLLDTPWPKVTRGKQGLAAQIKQRPDVDALLALLQDGEVAADQRLPDTGIGLERERLLSPLFIHSETYGTRASTVLLVDHHNQALFHERNFGPEGKPLGEQRFLFSLG